MTDANARFALVTYWFLLAPLAALESYINLAWVQMNAVRIVILCCAKYFERVDNLC